MLEKLQTIKDMLEGEEIDFYTLRKILLDKNYYLYEEKNKTLDNYFFIFSSIDNSHKIIVEIESYTYKNYNLFVLVDEIREY